MVNVVFALGCSFLLSFLVTPVMIYVSKKRKIFDIPDTRKKHKKPTPLLGGIAIYFATIMTTILSIIFFAPKLENNIIVAFLIGITGVTLMGLIDDILSLSARRRLIILFSLALIVIIGCLQYYFQGRFTNQGSLLLVLLFSLLWIVGITNAVNFSDGLDGLAGSLSAIAAAAFAVVFYFQGRTQLALPTVLAMFGAIAGFLPYNFNPAKIFMGDAGSMFIGFMLGMLSIMSMSQQDIIFCIVPIYFLFVPLMDMYVAVLRRLLMHKPVMKPDNMHFHHRLLKRFNNHKTVMVILALFQVFFAGIGLLVYFTKAYLLGWIGLLLVVISAGVYTYVTARVKFDGKIRE
ncbi:MAG: glycosyltransferase family 4 protein [Christensenellales bacterium]